MSSGFVEDASLWYANEYPDRRAFSITLALEMAGELIRAARSAQTKGLTFDRLTRESFPLPSMTALLDDALSILEDGRGFVVVQGIPVDQLSEQENVLALAGISRHLGELVAQSVRGNKIELITDQGRPLDHTSRGYAGTRGLAFHTDGSDYAALLCLTTAAEGGESLVASATAVYETIRYECPDLLAVLERGLFHHRRGEQAEGEPAVLPGRQPVFRIDAGRMHVFYNRNPAEWLAREGIIVSASETNAQDLLDAVLERKDIQLRMPLQSGDLQILNNYTVLHARTPYRDTDQQKRRMLRTWIRSRAPRRSGPNIIDLYAPWESRDYLESRAD